MKPGKAAAWLPFLRCSRMPSPIPIRTASAAALVSLAILVATLGRAQTASSAYPQDDSRFSIPLLSPQQMPPDDRTVAQSWQPAIANSAQFFGYTIDSSYTYREIACPVAPKHLLLAYEATAPNGSISRFTAVVSRGAEEENAGSHPVAQIIPILHFGVVPFIPAIANPHSIGVFNSAITPAPSATKILSANQAGSQPLLVRALCYLAIVGEEPAALGSPPSSPATIHAPIPALVFQNKGKIRQQLSIRSRQNSYEVWALAFQPGGNLLSATRQEHPIDRTPLVLDANNDESQPVPGRTTAIPPSGAPIRSETPAPTTRAAAGIAVAPPMALTKPAPPRIETPASPPPAATEAVAVPTLSTPAPSETKAPNVEPVTSPISAGAASNIGPVASAAPEISSPALAPEPEPAAGPSMAPPPASANVPPITAGPAKRANSAPPVSSDALVATAPVVKPSPPLPPGRFIPNPPPPPSRFIPDSALKTPPHLPQ
jgi:hypothetical protein